MKKKFKQDRTVILSKPSHLLQINETADTITDSQ